MLDEERETLCLYDNIDKVWRVHSSIRVHITRLTKLFGPPSKQTKNKKGEVVESTWTLPAKSVSFRLPTKRVVSEAQRLAAGTRLAARRRSIAKPNF